MDADKIDAVVDETLDDISANSDNLTYAEYLSFLEKLVDNIQQRITNIKENKS